MISGLRNWGSAGSTTSDSATLYTQPLPSWVFCRMGINTNSILEYRRLQCLPLEHTANPNHNLLSPFLESRCTPRRSGGVTFHQLTELPAISYYLSRCFLTGQSQENRARSNGGQNPGTSFFASLRRFSSEPFSVKWGQEIRALSWGLGEIKYVKWLVRR